MRSGIRKGPTKVLGSSFLGRVSYKVVRIGPTRVDIQISPTWREFFRIKGAKLDSLENIGNHRARQVMEKFVDSVK